MVTFLAFLVGLFLGMMIASAIMAWLICEYVDPVITRCSKSNDELTDTLLKIEEAIEDGTITFNGTIE